LDALSSWKPRSIILLPRSEGEKVPKADEGVHDNVDIRKLDDIERVSL